MLHWLVRSIIGDTRLLPLMLLTAVAAVFFLLGIWRMVEALLGPLLAPFVLAAVLAAIVGIWRSSLRRRQEEEQRRLASGQLPGRLLALWLAPRPLKRLYAAGLATEFLLWLLRPPGR